MWSYNMGACVNDCSQHGDCYFGFCLVIYQPYKNIHFDFIYILHDCYSVILDSMGLIVPTRRVRDHHVTMMTLLSFRLLLSIYNSHILLKIDNRVVTTHVKLATIIQITMFIFKIFQRFLVRTIFQVK
jgi:hypothetical protein